MKKLSALVLAFALAVPMGLTAFADDTPPADTTANNNGTESTSIAVQGTYQPGAAAGDSVIYVDVAWDAMDFTYTAPSKGDWDPKSHTYQNPIEIGGWAPTNGTAPKITVTNHSNTSVSTTLAFASTAQGVAGSFTDTTDDANPIPGNVLILNTAVGTQPAEAPTAQAAFTVSGDAIDKDQSIGTITVTVAKATEVSTNEALQAAIDDKKPYIKLTNNIEREHPSVMFNYDAVLDLDGYTLTVNDPAAVAVGYDNNYPTLMIKGGDKDGNYGTIKCETTYPALDISTAKAVAVENCNIISTSEDEPAISPAGCKDLLLKNCTTESNDVNGDIAIFSGTGTITLCGNIDISNLGNISSEDTYFTCLAGTYYNFDPSYFVDKSIYTVTRTGRYYTVTRKQPDQTGNQ